MAPPSALAELHTWVCCSGRASWKDNSHWNASKIWAKWKGSQKEATPGEKHVRSAAERHMKGTGIMWQKILLIGWNQTLNNFLLEIRKSYVCLPILICVLLSYKVWGSGPCRFSTVWLLMVLCFVLFVFLVHFYISVMHSVFVDGFKICIISKIFKILAMVDLNCFFYHVKLQMT